MIQVRSVGIPVGDQDRALEFYTQKLGFELEMDRGIGESQRWIQLRSPDSDVAVVLFTPPGHEARIGTFCNVVFTARDVEKTCAELRARGVEFQEELTEQAWGRQAIVRDPDGNTFCIVG